MGDDRDRGLLARVALRLAAALTHRNFLVLWCGAFISTVGTWMQKVAQNWLILLFLAGIALIMVFSLITSLVQLRAPDEMRGRVMSIFMVAFRGGMPLGSLVGGYAASLTSAPVVLTVGGILLTGVGTYFLTTNHRVRNL